MTERDVITQVDALINRHRASSTAVLSEDDLPVLTEIVDRQSVEVPNSIGPAPVSDPQLAARAALARELELWLDEKLPDAVLRILDGLSDQLITQVAAQARLELLPRLKAALDPKPGDD